MQYQLKGRTKTPEIIEIHHPDNQIDYILLPLDAFGRFNWLALPHDVELHANTLDVTPKRGWFGQPADPRPKIQEKARFAAPVRFGGCIYSYKKARKGDPRQSLHDNRGLDLGSEAIGTLLSSAMICDALPSLPDGPAPSTKMRLAVVLHLHYPDLWEEFAQVLSQSKLKFQLIVTLSAPNPELEAKIKAQFKTASIQVLENIGRDIRPFLQVLQSGALDEIDLICKLHAKRSILSGAKGSRFGHLWRRRNLLDLLGSPLQVSKILNAFETRPQLGMMGSAPLRLRNGNGPEPGFEASKPTRERLCQEANIDPNHIKDDLFAGTMFWIRRTALDPLRHLTISDDQYTPEHHQKGDQFEHALERFFADCTRAQGLLLADIEPLTLTPNDRTPLLAPRALWAGPSSATPDRWAKPLPDPLEDQRIALIATPDSDPHPIKQAGYLTALCTNVPSKDTQTDALFLRDAQDSHPITLWGAALRANPLLWTAKELLFVSDDIESPFHMRALKPPTLAHPEVRALFETALCWTHRREADFRYGSKLKEILDATGDKK